MSEITELRAKTIALEERLDAVLARVELLNEVSGTALSLLQPLYGENGDPATLGDFLAHLQAANTSAMREDLVGMAVGLAKGVDEDGNAGLIAISYAPNSKRMVAEYDYYEPS